MATDASTTVKKRDEYCCVPMCNGNARIHRELSFHHIPSEKKIQLRKQWIVAIKRDEGPMIEIGRNTVVCSRHFKKEDFRWTPNRKCLHPNAVPSVFDWKPPNSSRKAPMFRVLPTPTPSEGSDTSEDAEDNTILPLDLTEHMSSEEIDVHASCNEKIRNLEIQLANVSSELKTKEEQVDDLEQKLRIEKFGLNRFSYDDEMVEFYTSFPTYNLFMIFFEAIRPTAIRMKSAYYTPSDEINNRGRRRSMDPVDELFMFLCRLKCGFLAEDLSVRFGIHKSTVSRKIITWTNYLYFLMGSICIWPTWEQILSSMPEDFKILYPKTRVIIDCTEIFTEKPSSLALGSKTYSSYKSHNTWKGFVGIAPHGAITFISPLYSGCMSDIEITKLRGIINLLEPGDQIMADKGFVLNKVLEGTGISIATPHFLCADGQFSQAQIEDNQKIASLRIHVERHIKRVKEYRLFQTVVPLSIAGSVNQLWTIANLLTLFRRPLIKK